MIAADSIILAPRPDVRSPEAKDSGLRINSGKAVRLNGIITHDAGVHETEEGIQ